MVLVVPDTAKDDPLWSQQTPLAGQHFLWIDEVFEHVVVENAVERCRLDGRIFRLNVKRVDLIQALPGALCAGLVAGDAENRPAPVGFLEPGCERGLTA